MDIDIDRYTDITVEEMYFPSISWHVHIAIFKSPQRPQQPTTQRGHPCIASSAFDF